MVHGHRGGVDRSQVPSLGPLAWPPPCLVDSLDARRLPAAISWLLRNHVNHEVLSRGARLASRLPARFEVRVHHSTAGAMMHLKTAALLGPRPALVGGQANYTPNSFSGAWLETNLETSSGAMVRAFAEHFEELWTLPATRVAVPPKGLGSVAGEATRTLVLRAFRLAGLRP